MNSFKDIAEHLDIFDTGSKGPKCLFIQGLGIDFNLYRDLFSDLALNINIFTANFVGVGELDISLDDGKEITYQLIRQHQPDILMGHSTGGQYALELSDEVECAVGISPAFMVNPSSTELMRRYAKLSAELIARSAIPSDNSARAIVGSLKPLFMKPSRLLRYRSDIASHTFESASTANPIGFIIGKKDQLFWQKGIEGAIEQYFPNAEKYFLDELDHTAPVSTPKPIVAAIRDYLAQDANKGLFKDKTLRAVAN